MGRPAPGNPGAAGSREAGEERSPVAGLGNLNRRTVPVVLLLALLTLATFRGVTANGFVPFDDDRYVTANPRVLAGLTAGGVAWAFTSFEAANWHPLTWLSHMTDVALFGRAPGAHHASSLAIHAVNACLLFLVLGAYTGSRWRSAFVAALFAVHPLRVESVAWVAERKDLLAALFGLLALAAYLGHARRPGRGRLLLVAALFALGLMAKPMLVTLPFLLLLLDWWPLGRLGRGPLSGLSPAGALREKLPLFALAAAAAAVTLVAQRRGEALLTAAVLPWGARLGNALLSYLRYLDRAARPAELSVFYPHPLVAPPWWAAAGALCILAGVSVLAVRTRRRHPWLAVGWCWYLGMLVPVIGVVQAGSQAMADRYTYLPLVGPAVAIAWEAARLARNRRRNTLLPGAAAALWLAALAALTAAQVRVWRDGPTLFEHSLRVTRENWLMHNNLGTIRFLEGKTDEALRHYEAAVRINPRYPVARFNYGNALAATGDLEGAVAHLEAALRLKPRYAEAANNLGNYLLRLGRTGEALGQFRAALALEPGLAAAHVNLANLSAQSGRTAEALSHYGEAVRLQPDLAAARVGLGLALAGRGRWLEAEEQFSAAARIDPGDAFARYNLVQVRRTLGRDR